ncbi:MAG: hypothetical protein KatS3mg093_201 [Candidatus Parcubacteria bacterium]|nr:MAG: hypothetical protein KatS3mg093_201 [Candidatus Parcubacteria bacterium]
MPEENEKKINYKILTAEHLIEEKETESKETKISPEPSIEPEIIKKAEPVVSSQTIKENEIINKELEPIEINTKTESGVVHSPVEEVSLSPISFVEKPTFFSDSTNLTEQIPTVELKGLKPEPFTKEQPEELVSDVKPRFEIIKGESLVSNESSQSLSQETKVRKINFKPIIFITSSAIILIVGVFVLKTL